MRKVSFYATSAALALLLAVLPGVSGAAAQTPSGPGTVDPGTTTPATPTCLTCTVYVENGVVNCSINVASVGYTSCTCQMGCRCSGTCPATAGPGVATDTVVGAGTRGAVLRLVPKGGARLTSAPAETILAGLDRGRIFGELAANVYFGESYGLVRYSDESWRVFRLEDDGSMVIRGCDGQFLTRVHRIQSGDASRLSLTVASL